MKKVNVAVVVLIYKDQVLFQQRLDNDQWWHLPGGKIEKSDKHWYNGAHREIKEELRVSLNIQQNHFCAFIKGGNPDTNRLYDIAVYAYPLHEEELAAINNNEPHKVKSIGWFPINKPPERTHAYDRGIVVVADRFIRLGRHAENADDVTEEDVGGPS